MELIRLVDSALPATTYLVISKPGMDILKNIHYAGRRFRELNEKLSVQFLKAAYQTGGISDSLSEIAELSVLRSGIYYGIDTAFRKLAEFSIPTAHMGCAREKQSDGSFRAKMYLNRSEMLKEAKHLFTSEIIASGSTFESLFKEIPFSISKCTIFSVAAADRGCFLLNALGKDYKVRINLFVNCFIGVLSENQTDIPFFGIENPFMPPSVERALRRHYGNELYEAIPCCISDGGVRFCYPKKHYEEILEAYSKMKFGEKKSQSALERVLRETEGFLKEAEAKIVL